MTYHTGQNLFSRILSLGIYHGLTYHTGSNSTTLRFSYNESLCSHFIFSGTFMSRLFLFHCVESIRIQVSSRLWNEPLSSFLSKRGSCWHLIFNHLFSFKNFQYFSAFLFFEKSIKIHKIEKLTLGTLAKPRELILTKKWFFIFSVFFSIFIFENSWKIKKKWENCKINFGSLGQA